MRPPASAPARALAIAIAACAIVFALGMILAQAGRLVDDPEDFRAFYCAGKVAVAGADPYLAEPLRSCEDAAMRASGFSPMRGLVLPAPLPGYAIAFFALFSKLTFARASELYVLFLIATVLALSTIVHRLARVPLLAALAAFILSVGQISILDGQIVPIAILALAASAAALACGKPQLAGLAALVGMVEPHVALPACLALAIFVPKSRGTLALGIVALCAIAIGTLGVGANVEYLARVLPAHAHSEFASPLQYSLTSILYRLGVPSGIAVLCGSLSYLVTCTLGLAVARRIAERADTPALLVLVPPAFAILGGPFVHLTQIAVAIPALLVLCGRVPQWRNAYAPALVFLAIPWQNMAINDMPSVAIATLLVASALCLFVWKPKRSLGIAFVAATVAVSVAEVWTGHAFPLARTGTLHLSAAAEAGDRLAEITWTAFSSNALLAPNPWFYLQPIPTYLALLTFVGFTSYVAKRRDIEPPVGTATA